MATVDQLKHLIPYQSNLSAGDWNSIIDILKALSHRQVNNGIVDSTGVYSASTNLTASVEVHGLITSNATPNGAYNGKSFTNPAADVSPGTSIAEADFGTLAGSEDCLILNGAELLLATPGHYLTATANSGVFAIYFVGKLIRINAGNIKVVAVYMPFANC